MVSGLSLARLVSDCGWNPCLVADEGWDFTLMKETSIPLSKISHRSAYLLERVGSRSKVGCEMPSLFAMMQNEEERWEWARTPVQLLLLCSKTGRFRWFSKLYRSVGSGGYNARFAIINYESTVPDSDVAPSVYAF